MSGSGLPFERTRHNPVQDVTPEEAERNKRLMGKNQAQQDGKQPDDIPGADPAVKAPDPGKATD